MAKHGIRRWFQFGVLDLLILTAVVAIGAVLWRPAQLREPVAPGTTPGQFWSDNGLGMKFCWCPPGEFKMGEAPNPVDVKLTRGFWMGKYEVTQAEYHQVMNDNPSRFSFGNSSKADFVENSVEAESVAMDAEKRPVETVTWEAAFEFCRAFSEEERRAGRLPAAWAYQLPTEAQWEYACRAGTQTAYSFGDDESRLVNFAWCRANSQQGTHRVGRKPPNPWGLRDMYGNVWEMCQDSYQEKFTGGADPAVTAGDSFRVIRGGSWLSSSKFCGSAIRLRFVSFPNTDLGFRVVLVPSR